MGKTFLHHTLLNDFLEVLQSFGELHGPAISEQGVTVFTRLKDVEALHLDYRRTLIPPKKYLLPFREEILNYQGGAYRESLLEPPPVVLFGIHPCDLDGLAYLDQVFLGESPDPCYAKRRSGLTLIGISCEPDDFCFCSGARERAPCDLFLAAGEDGYELTPGSPQGERIAAAAGELLAPSKGAPSPTRTPWPIPPQDPQLRFSDNPLWEDFADRCVSCGACSVCCPTCYCFDVREYPGLTGGGSRLREWDNCLFVTHGEVTGGNFRPTRLERFRYRFLHKYCGFSPLQGICSCVGCGRCRKACPVDIDLREILELQKPEGVP